MNILITYVILIFVEFAGIIHVIADGVGHTIYDEDDFSTFEDTSTNDNVTYDDDGDFSISDDTEKNITDTNDTHILRSYVRYHAGAHKHYKKSDEAMAYIAFQCCVSEMNMDLENVYPQHPGSNHEANRKLYTANIRNEFPFPEELSRTIDLFSALEAKYYDDDSYRNSRAVWQIEMYYHSMNAFLSRCTNHTYYRYLSVKRGRVALSLRAEVLKMYNLMEKSEWAERKKAFENFSTSYARCLHACDAINRVYGNVLRNSKENLPEQLYSIGLLQAWNFTTNDLKHVNLVRFIGQRKYPLISAKPYSFKNNKAELVTGILPSIDVNTCLRLS